MKEINNSLSYDIDYDKTPLSKNYKKAVETNWEVGYITPSNGNNANATTSLRSVNKFSLTGNIIMKVKTGFRSRIYTYNNNGTFVSSTNWISTNDYVFTPENDKLYRFVINNNDVGAIDYSALDKVNWYYVDDYIDSIETLKDYTKGENSDYSILPIKYRYSKRLKGTNLLSNFEVGSITWNNGNNANATNSIRNKVSIPLPNRIAVLNLNPNKYQYRIIYYTEAGKYNSSYYAGNRGYTSQYQENFAPTYSYGRLLIADKLNTSIDMEDALKNILVFESTNKIRPINKSFITFYAHQGGLIDGIPQNTLDAFINATKYNYHGIETDVRVTSDGVYVITHDAVRTTYDGSETITISEVTYEELETYQFYEDPDIKIPTLEETLNLFKTYGLKFNLEFKDNFSLAQIQEIYDLIKKYNMEEHTNYNSFIVDNLLKVRQIRSNAEITLNINVLPTKQELLTDSNYESLRTLLSQNGITGLSFDVSKITDEQTLIDYIDLGYKINASGTDIDKIIQYHKYFRTLTSNWVDIDYFMFYLNN